MHLVLLVAGIAVIGAQNTVPDHVLQYFIPSPALPTQIPEIGGALQPYAIVAATAVSTGIRMPSGGQFTRSFDHGRIELFGGAGEVYVPFATRYSMPNSWLSQTTAGFRFSLDAQHHFWVGASAYYLTDFAGKKRQWAYGSADFTVRFGR
jgi:hypothetical protein